MNLVKNHIKIFRSKCFYRKNFFPTFNNSYHFKHFIRKRYFYSTSILNNLSTKRLSSVVSTSTIENNDYCPGCGAKFQTEDSLEPGYLIKPSSSTASSTNKKSNEKSNAKKLSKQEIEDAINKLPEDIKKLMYPFEYSSTSTRKEIKVGDSTLKEQERERRIFCQRCYNLKYHNKLSSSSSSSSSSSWQETLTMDKSFLNFLQKKKNSIILTIIDIFDFPGSLIKNLDNLIGKNNSNILIANKVDLLPKNFNENMIKNWLKNYCYEYGLKNIHNIFLCSAKKNWMIKDLCNEISKIKNYNDNIYLIGNTNVGKSELINSILRTYVHNGKKYEVTSSHIPGTTINMLGLPLDIFGDTFGKNIKGILFNNNNNDNNNQEDHRFLFDTPGIVNENQLFHFLDQEELKMIIPQRSIRPLTFVFKPG
jgi:ribosome biogenesis GTPase A